MNCKQISSALSDYLDGRADTTTEGIVREHLKGCSECQRDYNSLRATVNLLTTFEPARLSRDFDSRLSARLDSLEGARKRRGSALLSHAALPWKWAATAGAVAALSLAAWQLAPPCAVPSNASGGAYIAACVQANQSAAIPVRDHVVLDSTPGADLADETSD